MSPSEQPPASIPQSAPPKRRRAGWRTWVARLLVLSVTGLACLGGMEVLVRVFLPYYSPRNQFELQVNAEGVVTGPPGKTLKLGTPKGDWNVTMSFNRHGLRDTKDFTRSTPEDVFVIGDSYSLGWGVEETERYSNLLERRFHAPWFNLAIPEDLLGYQRTLAFAERHGARVRHMVIGLCMENDLWDYTLPGSTHVRYQKQMAVTLRHRVARWFKTHSALWICASYTLQKYPALRGFFEKIGIARNIEELTHKNDPSPQVLASTRDELVRLAANRHAVVLVIPSRALWQGRHTESERDIHDRMTRALREAGLSLVDMRPVLEQTGEPLAYYFKTDPHWNARGHALAADALARHFVQAPDWQFLRERPPPAR